MNQTVKKKKPIKDILIENALIIVILMLIAYIAIKEPAFLSVTTLRNIATQASTKLIMALGVGGLIVLAGTDLSAGRVVGLTAAISVALLQSADAASKYFPNMGENSIIVGLLAAIVVGALIGLINGIGVAKLKLHAFIATLGTQLIAYSLLQAFINNSPHGAQPLSGFTKSYENFVKGSLKLGSIEIPYLIIYAMIASAIMWFVWNKTVLGKNMFAIGGNEEAAAVSGINVDRNIIYIFLISGVMYGIAGFLEAPRLGNANIVTGTNYELDAIAACVIGGVSFLGGVGKISGIILGTLLLQVINYGLIFVGLESYWQLLIKGLLIIVAVALDTRKYLKKK
ncbi:galactose/methyl galactoside ABC transporter permease MglC [Helcococcus sueciensis]|uniref:galactose/methyl galactoside ABC transporter permease MglC n=1 Tax=Helcococcus sueciensis TaxID=241555 RepID=UPI0004016295|nr:galactose/methyl galactoside ABC transporter permease MglC [Helcococcus sueciensis]